MVKHLPTLYEKHKTTW